MDVRDAPIDLDRDGFLRDLITELGGLLEEVVGLDDASGFVALVGQRIGRRIDQRYRAELGDGEWPITRLAEVLADLKHRIQGGFRIESIDGLRIVLVSTSCPFGDQVRGRPSLCMMTSNVFGTIAAEHRGYAQVAVERAIARGDDGCRVVVNLDPEAPLPSGRHYRRL